MANFCISEGLEESIYSEVEVCVVITWVCNLQHYETMSCADMFVYVQGVVFEDT